MKAVTVLTVAFITISCAAPSLQPPSVYPDAFDGFEATPEREIRLRGYEYERKAGGTVEVASCAEVTQATSNRVVSSQFEWFRRLLLTCRGYEKYLEARRFERSFIPTPLALDQIRKFPAQIIPSVNDEDSLQKRGKTVQQYYSGSFEYEARRASHRLVTEHEILDLQPLARGDFDGDGTEDLLLVSSWSPIQGFGATEQVLIVTRSSADGPFRLVWQYE